MGERPRRGPALAILAGVFGVLLVLTTAVELRILGDALARPGLDGFYASPSDATDAAPGALLRAEPLVGAPLAARAWRIMYRTTTVTGDAAVASGILVVPLLPAPPGGRTVLSWAHPTTGSAEDCAPSRAFDPFIGIEGLRPLLDRGYAVVATDYVGMGTDGPDSYLVGTTGGNAVLDAVRAAQQIDAADATDDVILWGHSQGGGAALFAAQQAADYAPELTVRAVAVAAPAADLTQLVGDHLDDISGVTIGSYAFTAFADVYGPTVPGAELDSILTADAQRIVPQMTELCLLPNLDKLHAMGEPLVGDFVASDPTKTEPWATLLAENSAGGAAFDAPLFIAQGRDDQLILPADTAAFAAHEASLGIPVTYVEIPVATHSTIAYAALPPLLYWLDRVTS